VIFWPPTCQLRASGCQLDSDDSSLQQITLLSRQGHHWALFVLSLL